METRSRHLLLAKIILLWQTKSHAIIVHHLVPPDCFVKVIAKNGEQTLFERLSKRRPAPKVILRSSWQVQQQQQPQQPATRLKRLGANRAEEESQDNGTEITTSIFKIDLRVASIILVLSNPNVQLHQFAGHLDRNDVPVGNHF